MLCPNYQLAPFIKGAAPTVNIFMLIDLVGVPVYKRCSTNYQHIFFALFINGAAPFINISHNIIRIDLFHHNTNFSLFKIDLFIIYAIFVFVLHN